MNSPGNASSPTYKHLKYKLKQSPVELKEKMRKNYKDKVQNCRNMLFNKFRGSAVETDLRETLNEIYKSMFNFSDDSNFEIENEVLEEIRNELVQDEMEWWLQDYEKSQMDNIDWSSLESDDHVICPLCQKANLTLHNTVLSCTNCKTNVNTTKSLLEIKQSLLYAVEKHSNACNNDVQFTLIPESNETHVYLICDGCMDMLCVI